MATINHEVYGVGEVIKVNKKTGLVTADFGWVYDIRDIGLTAFDLMKATTDDVDLKKILNKVRRNQAKKNPNCLKIHGVSYGRDSFFEGNMAEDISCSTAELFEAIGYIVKNVRYIEAAISQDKVELFEDMFHTDICYIHNDVENARNQFSIHFNRTDNIPKILEDALSDSGKGKIARSLFVERLVKEFGFAFGTTQNVENIRAIADRYGYLAEFEKGFAL